MGGIRDAYARWQKLLAESPGSAEYVAAGQELLQSIADTDADLQDLAETVVVVENNRDRFRITDAELAARRQFLADTKAELARIAADVQSPDTERRSSSAVCSLPFFLIHRGGYDDGGAHTQDDKKQQQKRRGARGAAGNGRYAKLDEAIAEENGKFIAGQDAAQLQILARQDAELDALGRSVAVLGDMGKTMSAELAAHGQMLEDLDDEVTRTDTRLSAARRKVDSLVQKSKDNCMTILIWVLLAVLAVLIILIFVL